MITVETPTRLTDRQRELLEELAALRGEDGYVAAEEGLLDRIKNAGKGGKSRKRKNRRNTHEK